MARPDDRESSIPLIYTSQKKKKKERHADRSTHTKQLSDFPKAAVLKTSELSINAQKIKGFPGRHHPQPEKIWY